MFALLKDLFGALFGAIKKLFGPDAERDFKKGQPLIEEMHRHDEPLAALSDAELFAKTAGFRQVLQERTADLRSELDELDAQLRGDLEPGERGRLNDRQQEINDRIHEIEDSALDEIQPEAFAVVKDACRRLCGRKWDVVGTEEEWFMVPYDVQLYGGTVLHSGKIAEMATGEGKTLVAVAPLYLNALTGRGCHLITHNNYLAKRDAMWMGGIYNFLGLSVGVIQDARQTGGAEAYVLPAPDSVPQAFEWQPATRKQAYAADIVYATKDQVGFDYLYDNMATRREHISQREFNYAIVDEADSNLIDDARTPLIISGPVPDATNRYAEFKPLVEKLLRAQTQLVNKLVSEAEKRKDNADDEYDVGVDLLRATRGAPKNKRLLKVQQEEGIKRLIGRVESDFMRDKRMPEIDEGLYFVVDERGHTIDLTDMGRDLLSPDEQALFIIPDVSEEIGRIRKDESLTDDEKRLKEDEAYRGHQHRTEAVHNINQLMKAYTLFEKDVQYMVTEDRKVVIVDESTGRPQPGRRFADGLHQALEAKEGVKVEQETQTVATITLQNLFRLYRKMAGMTGTAETESAELWEIYHLDVVVIPTHRPIRRLDFEDQIYRTKREKYNAIIEDVQWLHERGLPVLVGTISVEISELLSRMLTRKGIKHQLLNARYHEKEAEVVAQAGQPGQVTIATNMAGRGTDIKLNPEVLHIERELISNPEVTLATDYNGRSLQEELTENPSGLQVIGTERHESRRIDRQLRGRAGRQGDPGSSRFYMSLEDDLMRLFGSERIAKVMDRLGAEEGEVIEHSMVTRSIERAQKKVEARNFEMRKHLLKYDDVMNQQRQVIYNRRRDILDRDSVHDQVMELVDDSVSALVTAHAQPGLPPEEWTWEDLSAEFSATFFTPFPVETEERAEIGDDELQERLLETARASFEARRQLVTEETFREVEKAVLLHTVDTCWQEHLHEMDELKEGVGFAGVAGKDPLLVYQKEAFEMFESLIARIDSESIRNLFQLRIDAGPPPEARRDTPSRSQLSDIHREATNLGFRGAPPAAPATPGVPAAGGDGMPLGRPADEAAPRQRGLVAAGSEGTDEAKKTPVRSGPKVGRNDPCPCGSGKKYKQCHGRG
jgi:preprotein translocase subunit SecA